MARDILHIIRIVSFCLELRHRYGVKNPPHACNHQMRGFMAFPMFAASLGVLASILANGACYLTWMDVILAAHRNYRFSGNAVAPTAQVSTFSGQWPPNAASYLRDQIVLDFLSRHPSDRQLRNEHGGYLSFRYPSWPTPFRQSLPRKDLTESFRTSSWEPPAVSQETYGINPFDFGMLSYVTNKAPESRAYSQHRDLESDENYPQWLKLRELECLNKHGPGWVPVGERCHEIHSESICRRGRWLVRNRTTRLFECQKIPCGGNRSSMVSLKNGTCVSVESLSGRNICSPNQDLFMTKYGYVDCDCKTDFVFWKADNACHQLYTRGPCPLGKILGVVPGMDHVACIDNPCSSDDFVALDYHDGGNYCYKIGTQGPCRQGQTFSIDSRTLLPTCKPLKIGLEMDHAFFCRNGSVRKWKKMCLTDAKSVGGFCEDPEEKVAYDPEESCELPLLSAKFCQNPGSWLILRPGSDRNPQCAPFPCRVKECLTSGGECIDVDKFKTICSNKGMVAVMTIRGAAICDCPDFHGYLSQDGKCYEVYTRGPCDYGEIFVHSPEASNVMTSKKTSIRSISITSAGGMKCMPNPCPQERQILWNDGRCYEIGTAGPCEGDFVKLLIDKSTLQAACSKKPEDFPVGYSIFDSLTKYKSCQAGSKRDFKGDCVQGFMFT